MKIEDDLRKSTSEPREPESEIARRNAERRLFGISGSVSNQSDRIRQEMQRYASMRDPHLRYEYVHHQFTMCDFHNFGLIFAGQCTVCLKD